MKYLKDAYLFGEFKEAVETFQDFEFVEFSKIFQNLLYFCDIIIFILEYFPK